MGDLGQSSVPARWCSRCEWYVPAAHEPHRSPTLGWHYADLDVAPDDRRDERSGQAQDRSSRLVGAEREPTPETPSRGRSV